MNARQTMTCIALLAGLGLTGCGSPSDMPTAVDTGSVRVAAQSTPTLVPTILPSATPTASVAPSPTAAPSATSAATTIPTAAATPSATPDASPSASPAPSDDASDGHPIAQVIADEFGVSVAEVEAYHAQGIGYGILAQFYSIAYQRCAAQSAYTVDQLVAMKLGGMGMGEIRKQALGSAAANQCSLGRLKQEDLDAVDNARGGPPEDKGNNGNNGDDNGKADDKGNNGKADDKGNNDTADDKGNNGGGNGNSGGKGNGNGGGGNSGGNGNGNGGGKGKGK